MIMIHNMPLYVIPGHANKEACYLPGHKLPDVFLRALGHSQLFLVHSHPHRVFDLADPPPDDKFSHVVFWLLFIDMFLDSIHTKNKLPVDARQI